MTRVIPAPAAMPVVTHRPVSVNNRPVQCLKFQFLASSVISIEVSGTRPFVCSKRLIVGHITNRRRLYPVAVGCCYGFYLKRQRERITASKRSAHCKIDKSESAMQFHRNRGAVSEKDSAVVGCAYCVSIVGRHILAYCLPFEIFELAPSRTVWTVPFAPRDSVGTSASCHVQVDGSDQEWVHEYWTV